MNHLLEILKIIEGALKTDRNKVFAYSEQLVNKLQKEGDVRGANRIKKVLDRAPSNELSLARHSSNGRIPVDSESRFTLADEELLDISDAGIFLNSEDEATVEEFLRYVRCADKLLAHGVGISPSLLIYGPPGCGKTELARNISAQLSLPLLTARTDSLISSYLGSTAKNLRSLFEHSMARPCVLFLDEFDAVGKLRDDRYELGELKRVVVSLLQNIDAMDNKTVLIAATNHEHLLDPAIWRRFGYKIRLDYPDKKIREKIFLKYLNKFSKTTDIKTVISASKDLSGSDIKQLCEKAIREAVLEGRDRLNLKKFLKDILKLQLPDVFGNDVDLEKSLKAVRAFDSKVFTYRILSEIFGISVGKIGTILKLKETNTAKECNNGRRSNTATNKGGVPSGA
jgi:SpoVK/Ycf46/Vps4 family AAA+-type ATPase